MVGVGVKTMRTINRLNSPAHHLGIFQREIFWPTLESIYETRKEVAALDGEENELLAKMIHERSLIDIDATMQRQKEINDIRRDKLAEVERKWTLVHAGCQFMAMTLNEGREEETPELTPTFVYRTLVLGHDLHHDGIEVLECS